MRLSSKEASALRVVLLSVLSIAVAALAIWLLWTLRSIVALGIAAAFAAFLFLPIAHWLNRKTRLPMGITCAVVVLAIVGVFVGLVAVTIPPLVSETRSLVTSLPDYAKTLQGYFSRLSVWLDRLQLGAAKDTITAVLDAVQKAAIQFGQNIVTSSSKKLLGLSALLPFFVLMYFFMSGSHGYYEMSLSLPFVRTQKDRAAVALAQVAASTRRYIEALAAIAMVTSLFVGGVSGLFGINYALTIGVVDFFAEFIPYVGPFVVVVLGAFFAAVTGPGKLIEWLIIFGVIEFLTSQILAPRLISKKTGINPALIILLLLAGGTLAGFFGLLLVVPLAVSVGEVIKIAQLLRSTPEDVTEKPVD
ncbi:MAG: AI-2E family transporter [Caldiserica bacterium]|nr:AI-2E family transporter [Caldisericota bacterium]